MSTTRFTELQLEGVSRSFGHGRHRFAAVDDVSLRIAAGDRVGIVGESGSGKSTVSRMIAALDSPDGGKIYVDGVTLASVRNSRSDLVEYRRTVQMVSQDSTSSFDPLQKVRTAVRVPAMQLAGLDKHAADERVDETLTALGLPLALAERRPHELSGGQRQRFSLARALVVRPRVLICDEVVSALDVSVQGQVLNMIKRYCLDEEAALIFVSHGLPATAFICERLVVMRNGKVVEDGDTDQVLHRSTHEYTKQLIDAFHGAPRAKVASGSGVQA
jgi:ABC-type dipeptide/oligopeptide/nickel transport system ATPase subunit